MRDHDPIEVLWTLVRPRPRELCGDIRASVQTPIAFTGGSAQRVHSLTANTYNPGRLLTSPYHPPLALVAPSKSLLPQALSSFMREGDACSG